MPLSITWHQKKKTYPVIDMPGLAFIYVWHIDLAMAHSMPSRPSQNQTVQTERVYIVVET